MNKVSSTRELSIIAALTNMLLIFALSEVYISGFLGQRVELCVVLVRLIESLMLAVLTSSARSTRSICCVETGNIGSMRHLGCTKKAATSALSVVSRHYNHSCDYSHKAKPL